MTLFSTVLATSDLVLDLDQDLGNSKGFFESMSTLALVSMVVAIISLLLFLLFLYLQEKSDFESVWGILAMIVFAISAIIFINYAPTSFDSVKATPEIQEKADSLNETAEKMINEKYDFTIEDDLIRYQEILGGRMLFEGDSVMGHDKDGKKIELKLELSEDGKDITAFIKSHEAPLKTVSE